MRTNFLRALSGTLPLRRHFTVFVIMTVFALAQLTWWVYYQVQEGQRYAHIQNDIWQQQLQLARQHAGISASPAPMAFWLKQAFPDLEVAPEVICASGTRPLTVSITKPRSACGCSFRKACSSASCFWSACSTCTGR